MACTAGADDVAGTDFQPVKPHANRDCQTAGQLLFGGFLFFSVGAFDAELLQSILQRAESEAEQFRCFGDVVIGRIHRLENQVLFDFFKINPFGGQFEAAADRGL